MTQEGIDPTVLKELRKACRAAKRAEDAIAEAFPAREQAAHRTWPQLHRLGPAWVAKEIGHDVISEPMMRRLTDNLQPRPPRGPRQDTTLAPDEKAALEELRRACKAAAKARKQHKKALTVRDRALRDTYAATAHVTPGKLARLIGSEFVGESTIRAVTADLRRG